MVVIISMPQWLEGQYRSSTIIACQVDLSSICQEKLVAQAKIYGTLIEIDCEEHKRDLIELWEEMKDKFIKEYLTRYYWNFLIEKL